MGQPVSTALGGPRVIRAAVPAAVRRRRLRGLGQNCMSNSDFEAALNCGQYNCGPYDEQCIACKTQCANAISNLMDSGCVAPGTPVSWSCDTSVASVYGSTGQTGTSNATVGTGSGAFVATGPAQVLSTPYTATQPTAAQMANCPSLVFYNGVCANPIPTASAGQNANTPGPAPPQATVVVNPSPPLQTTNGSTAAASTTSAVSQANGTTTSSSGDLLSTVAGYVNSYPDIISGLDNSTLLTIAAIGAGALLIYAASKGR